MVSITRDQIMKLAAEAARSHGLDPSLVLAVIEQESGFDTWAVNPEPHYRWLWDFRHNRPFRGLTQDERRNEKPPLDFYSPPWTDRDAEWWCQQMSWGLMQTMGAVARERGFAEKWLTRLCDPYIGIEFGCRHLAVLMKATNGMVGSALLRWNGGGNKNYPAEVLARRERYL